MPLYHRIKCCQSVQNIIYGKLFKVNEKKNLLFQRYCVKSKFSSSAFKHRSERIYFTEELFESTLYWGIAILKSSKTEHNYLRLVSQWQITLLRLKKQTVEVYCVCCNFNVHASCPFPATWLNGWQWRLVGSVYKAYSILHVYPPRRGIPPLFFLGFFHFSQVEGFRESKAEAHFWFIYK